MKTTKQITIEIRKPFKDLELGKGFDQPIAITVGSFDESLHAIRINGTWYIPVNADPKKEIYSEKFLETAWNVSEGL